MLLLLLGCVGPNPKTEQRLDALERRLDVVERRLDECEHDRAREGQLLQQLDQDTTAILRGLDEIKERDVPGIHGVRGDD